MKLLIKATVSGLALTAALAGHVRAENLTPELVGSVDQRGFDFVTSRLSYEEPGVSIGSNGSGLAQSGRTYFVPGAGFVYTSNFYATLNKEIQSGVTYVTVTYGGGSEKYKLQSGVYVPVSGAVNAFACSGTLCTYTYKDGTQVIYDTTMTSRGSMAANWGVATQVAKPDGEVLTFKYRTVDLEDPNGPYTGLALKTVGSSLGWMIKYSADPMMAGVLPVDNIKALNTSVDYCDPDASDCSLTVTQDWINTDHASGASPTITNDAGQAVTITKTGAIGAPGAFDRYVASITAPSGASKSITYYTSGTYVGRVNTITVGSSTWVYAYSSGVTTVTSPDGGVRTVTVNSSKQVVSDQDPLGRKVTYTYDANGRLSRVINPDATYSGTTVTGGYTEYGYDSRDNVTTITAVPKAGSGLSNLVTYYNYPMGSCGNPKTCNKPTSVTDPNGMTVSYAYSTTHGGVTSVTLPTVGGVAPQTRYTYGQFTPYIKNSSGALVAQPQVWRLTETSACRAGAAPACLGTTDEVKTVISYGTNNVLPMTVTRKLGNNTQTTTDTYTYDAYGNITSVDGPLPNSDDTTYYFYDANLKKRLIGTIGADPDGAGGLRRRASRTTYNADGKTSVTEYGHTAGTNLAALNGMTVVDKSTYAYDTTTGLLSRANDLGTNATTPNQVTQYTYDSSLRVSCIAKRLNPAEFSSLPLSACTLDTAGVDGDDRITQYTYDLTGAVQKVTTALGTTKQADAVVRSYKPSNGLVETLADGKANKTTLYYDGFNRLNKTCLPTADNGAISSTTDCEQMAFTAARATTATRRDGQSITYNYDALGRVGSISGAVIESFSYDNFHQVSSHTNNGITETYGYDALGQLQSHAQNAGTVSYTYDSYGRRDTMTYPAYGGATFVLKYLYRSDNTILALQTIYNGSLVTRQTYQKDHSGAETFIWNGPGNALTQTFGYDSSWRNTTINNNILNNAGDNIITQTYAVSGQAKTRANTNAAYDYILPGSASLTSSLNGLNRVAAVNSTNFTYDGRGNLTSDGAVTYTYNVKNLLTATSTGAALTYDAEDRLLTLAKSDMTTKFLYDGADIVAEYDGTGVLLRRYVHGPLTDNPVVWFEGTSDASPRYLASDQLGSIVGMIDAAGNNVGVNTYDAYGVPGALNTGRFQYTGQAYLREIGLHYYKARMYSPTLGRFLQTDPIGYGDGMNIYTYVRGDPVNSTDPWGLACNRDGGAGVIVICPQEGGGGISLPAPLTAPNTMKHVSPPEYAPMEGDVVLINAQHPMYDEQWAEEEEFLLEEGLWPEIVDLLRMLPGDSPECMNARQDARSAALALAGAGMGTLAFAKTINKAKGAGKRAWAALMLADAGAAYNLMIMADRAEKACKASKG